MEKVSSIVSQHILLSPSAREGETFVRPLQGARARGSLHCCWTSVSRRPHEDRGSPFVRGPLTATSNGHWVSTPAVLTPAHGSGTVSCRHSAVTIIHHAWTEASTRSNHSPARATAAKTINKATAKQTQPDPREPKTGVAAFDSGGGRGCPSARSSPHVPCRRRLRRRRAPGAQVHRVQVAPRAARLPEHSTTHSLEPGGPLCAGRLVRTRPRTRRRRAFERLFREQARRAEGLLCT